MISRLTRYYCCDFLSNSFFSTSFLINIGKEMSPSGVPYFLDFFFFFLEYVIVKISYKILCRLYGNVKPPYRFSSLKEIDYFCFQ